MREFSKKIFSQSDSQVFLISVIISFVAVSICAWLLFVYLKLTATEAAAWVQAVGSIVAIIGAYHLGELNYRRGKKDRANLDFCFQNEALLRVISAIELSCNRVGYLRILLEGDSPELKDESIADIQDCTWVLKETLTDIKNLPDLWVKGTQATQILRKVFESARSAKEATEIDRKAEFQRALGQSCVFLAFSSDLRREIQAGFIASPSNHDYLVPRPDR